MHTFIAVACLPSIMQPFKDDAMQAACLGVLCCANGPLLTSSASSDLSGPLTSEPCRLSQMPPSLGLDAQFTSSHFFGTYRLCLPSLFSGWTVWAPCAPALWLSLHRHLGPGFMSCSPSHCRVWMFGTVFYPKIQPNKSSEKVWPLMVISQHTSSLISLLEKLFIPMVPAYLPLLNSPSPSRLVDPEAHQSVYQRLWHYPI